MVARVSQDRFTAQGVCGLYWSIRRWIWRLRHGEPKPLTNEMITRECVRLFEEKMGNK
jgi:hypothetical protein